MSRPMNKNNECGEEDATCRSNRPQRRLDSVSQVPKDASLTACSILIQKLNAENEGWGQPVKVAEAKGSHCECVHLRDRKRKLLIQLMSLAATTWEQWDKE